MRDGLKDNQTPMDPGAMFKAVAFDPAAEFPHKKFDRRIVVASFSSFVFGPIPAPTVKTMAPISRSDVCFNFLVAHQRIFNFDASPSPGPGVVCP